MTTNITVFNDITPKILEKIVALRRKHKVSGFFRKCII